MEFCLDHTIHPVDPMDDDRDRARDREKIGTGSKQGKGWRGRLDLDFVCEKKCTFVYLGGLRYKSLIVYSLWWMVESKKTKTWKT